MTFSFSPASRGILAGVHLILTRGTDTGNETLGKLSIENDATPSMYTIERPWKDNKPRISCIPKGTYKFVPHNWEGSPTLKFKHVYRLLGVPGRSAILIHVGNTVEDVIGCIAVGMIPGSLKGKPSVIDSKKAIDRLRSLIGNNSGSITIL